MKTLSVADKLGILALLVLLAIHLLKIVSDWSSHVIFVESVYSVGDGTIYKMPLETIRRIVKSRIEKELDKTQSYEPSVTFLNKEMHIDIALPSGHTAEPILKGIEADLVSGTDVISREPLNFTESAMKAHPLPQECLDWLSHLRIRDLRPVVAPSLIRFSSRPKPRLQPFDVLAAVVLVGGMLAWTRKPPV